MRDTSGKCMIGLRIAAFVLSGASWISSISKRRPSSPVDESSTRGEHLPSIQPSTPSIEPSREVFLVNHPYQGRFDSINLINVQTGISLLYIIDSGSAREVIELVNAALQGDPINRAPAAILDHKAHPTNIPNTWWE